MKWTLLSFALFSACGTDHATTTALVDATFVPEDLTSAAVVDLGSGPDLAQDTSPLGCKGYVKCIDKCTDNATCAAACMARLTADGKATFNDGVGCGQAFCLDSSTVPARCMQSGSALVDPPGTPTGTCNTCLTNALAAYFGAMCMPSNSPDCNPDGCVFTVEECQESLP